MPEMSMNRAIHGAFRRDITRFLQALGEFADGDVPRARQLSAAWRNFQRQLEHHHRGEHEIAWPALRALGVGDDTLAQLDAEHDAMAAALAEASAAMTNLGRSATGGAEARAAMHRLQDVMVGHMEHEESITEPVYVDHRESDAVKEMGRRFGRAQSPLASGTFLAWVLDGATDEERRGIADNVPGPVITLVGGLLGAPYRWRVAPTWQVPARA